MKEELTAPFGYCRVEAVLRSEAGSEIHSAFWLPQAEAWNGKFVGIGNGGFGGVIQEGHMWGALRQGYAVAATDMGHAAGFPKALATLNAKWAHQQPVKVADWAHRANHLTALTGKELIAGYFGKPPKRAYFHGCSDGGREALMQAGRYPEDYDGIIAGAPAAHLTDLAAQFMWNAQKVAATELTGPKLQRLHAAVLAHCDELDGAKDGLLEDPRACRFDPTVLQCSSAPRGENASNETCLTPQEVDAVRAIYQGPRTREGAAVSTGFSPGSEYETGWSLWITGPSLPLVGTVKKMTGQSLLATDFYRWMVHGDSDWSRDKFDLDTDLALGRQKLGALVNANELGLSAFFARNHKLLIYHGWADAALPAMSTIAYYDGLRFRHGQVAAQQTRLFMAPGMGHCQGGPGPNVFDAMKALDDWVDGGAAPERLVASKFDNDELGALGLPAKLLRTRPLCAWPRVARWQGTGSLDQAENFGCVTPGAR